MKVLGAQGASSVKDEGVPNRVRFIERESYEISDCQQESGKRFASVDA